jgi:phage-related protein
VRTFGGCKSAFGQYGRPMKTLGRGVRELRAAGSSDQYRAIYVIRKADGIYILHAFVKKSRTTARHDIETAKRRLKDI